MRIRKFKSEVKLLFVILMLSCLTLMSAKSAGAQELSIERSGNGIVLVSAGTDNETLIKEFPWSGELELNSPVTLRAYPDVFGGWEFSSWDGGLTGSTNPATITMDSDKNIKAIFVEKKEENIQR